MVTMVIVFFILNRRPFIRLNGYFSITIAAKSAGSTGMVNYST